MKAALALECIGDDSAQLLRRVCAAEASYFRSIGQKYPEAPREYFGPWVARLASYDPITERFEREFLRGQKDYGLANSKGSRGVYLHFWLDHGQVYEVHARESWKRSRRYFAAVSDDLKVVEISKEDAILCLDR